MAGRRPLPTQIRILGGNAGHRPIIGDDIQPTAGPPEMPKGLSRLARREFRFLRRALHSLGVLTVVDGSALASYCEAFAQKQKALKELERLGAAIETYSINKDGERVFLGIKKNPWWSVWVDACKLEKAFLIEFGLTPASRRKLKITPPRTGADIRLENIIMGRPYDESLSEPPKNPFALPEDFIDDEDPPESEG